MCDQSSYVVLRGFFFFFSGVAFGKCSSAITVNPLLILWAPKAES